MMRFQRTIQSAILCEGVGLHTGKAVAMRIKPAAADTGIVFVRTDLGGCEIEANAVNAADTSYATTLCRNGAAVKTVEHLLAAFAGLTIDNAVVELDAEEVPIMDGSAGPFIRLIAEAGITCQEKPRQMIKVVKPVFVRDGSKQIAIWPADAQSISAFIDFDHPMIQEQSIQYAPTEGSFLREVADARTFGFMRDVERLQANGLARGASMANAVALSEDSVLNTEGLRYRDEFVRHKVLDLIGDLSLAGAPIIGHIVAHKAGHALHLQLVSKLLCSPEDWVLLGSQEEAAIPQQQPRYQHAAL
jgi:UDP-3-O-[3-hydroxymyristoyl] N-acetylglucosamine deacetylase